MNTQLTNEVVKLHNSQKFAKDLNLNDVIIFIDSNLEVNIVTITEIKHLKTRSASRIVYKKQDETTGTKLLFDDIVYDLHKW